MRSFSSKSSSSTQSEHPTATSTAIPRGGPPVPSAASSALSMNRAAPASSSKSGDASAQDCCDQAATAGCTRRAPAPCTLTGWTAHREACWTASCVIPTSLGSEQVAAHPRRRRQGTTEARPRHVAGASAASPAHNCRECFQCAMRRSGSGGPLGLAAKMHAEKNAEKKESIGVVPPPSSRGGGGRDRPVVAPTQGRRTDVPAMTTSPPRVTLLGPNVQHTSYWVQEIRRH